MIFGEFIPDGNVWIRLYMSAMYGDQFGNTFFFSSSNRLLSLTAFAAHWFMRSWLNLAASVEYSKDSSIAPVGFNVRRLPVGCWGCGPDEFPVMFLKWRRSQLTNNNKAWCFKLSDFLGESANDFLVFHFENLLGTLTMPGAVSFCFNDTFVDFWAINFCALIWRHVCLL